ncbi:MAG TPA: hypothetical protein VGQ13_06580 [Nitrososphaera sp.]|nr:hypothetical protein [Nitrososphaera sp.]
MKQTDMQLKMTQDQVTMTKQQMDSTMRPWIGPAPEGLKADGKGLFIFNYHNYGQVPAEDILFEFALSDERVERQNLLDKPVETSKHTILLPNESKYRKNTFDFEKRKPIGPSLFIGILIRYKYANARKGMYGARIEYKFATGGIDYFDEWSE